MCALQIKMCLCVELYLLLVLASVVPNYLNDAQAPKEDEQGDADVAKNSVEKGILAKRLHDEVYQIGRGDECHDNEFYVFIFAAHVVCCY